MRLTTKKLDAGLYAIVNDGRRTSIVIGKGEPPKYRCRQEWHIGVVYNSHTEWLVDEQQSLEGAVSTVSQLLTAATVFAAP